MTFFQAFRNNYGFTSYGDNRTAVSSDIALVIVTYICVLSTISTLIATLGIRGRERWAYAFRASYAVAICSIILACLVGHDWQEGSVKMTSPYIYRSNIPFDGHVAIKVGLQSVNVSLDGHYDGASGRGYVYYSESILWSAFGHESEAYHFYLMKGLPEPILKVMGFLTADQGGFRWGRSYHTSGYYATVLLGASFAFWIISNLLMCSVVVYGAYMFMLTGLTMVLACVTYHVSQCPLQLAIRFNGSVLQTSYGWCFWLTLAAGCTTVLLAVVLIVADHLVHETVSDFFNLEKLTNEDPYECDSPKLPHGSIFLATCRIPRNTSNETSLLPDQAEIVLHPSRLSNIFKDNPGKKDEKRRRSSAPTGHRNSVTFQLEYIGEEAEISLSDIEASLYTLHEGIKSEVTRRKSSLGSGILYQKETNNEKQNRRTGKREINSIDLTQKEASDESSSTDESRYQSNNYQMTEQNFVLRDIFGGQVSEELAARDSNEISRKPQPSCSVSIDSGETTAWEDE